MPPPALRSLVRRALRGADANDLTDEALTDLLCAVQHRLFRAGVPVQVEQIVAELPGIRTRTEVMLHLLLAERMYRTRHGLPADPAGYFARFPDLREALCRQFAVADLLEDGDTSEPIDAPEDELTDDIVATPTTARAEGELGRLGGYRVLSEWWRDDQGVTYRARLLSRKSAGEYALRVPRQKSTQEWSRVWAVAGLLAGVEHPHLAPLAEVAEANGVMFVAVRLPAGEPLEERLTRGPALDRGERVRLGRQLAAGLAAVHAAGRSHGAVGPRSVWVEAGQRLQVRLVVLEHGSPIEPGDCPTDDLVQLGRLLRRVCGGAEAPGTLTEMATGLVTGRAKSAGAVVAALEALERELGVWEPEVAPRRSRRLVWAAAGVLMLAVAAGVLSRRW